LNVLRSWLMEKEERHWKSSVQLMKEGKCHGFIFYVSF